jgi:hypothetical protein
VPGAAALDSSIAVWTEVIRSGIKANKEQIMDGTSIGVALAIVGLMLTVWSMIYAKAQSRKMTDLTRNQNITMWATLSRVGRSISDITQITDNEDFLDNGQLTERQKLVLPKVHRGLSSLYIRLAELIVQNNPDMTTENIVLWFDEQRPGLESEWRKEQFLNLIIAGQPNTRPAVQPETRSAR